MLHFPSLGKSMSFGGLIYKEVCYNEVELLKLH